LARAAAKPDFAGRLEAGDEPRSAEAGHEHLLAFAIGNRASPGKGGCNVRDAVEFLAERHERFGFDSFMPHEPNRVALGQIIGNDPPL
jgi:hypothetical protein